MRFTVTLSFESQDQTAASLVVGDVEKYLHLRKTAPKFTYPKQLDDEILIYTDGGCDPITRLGAWAAVIEGNELDTELTGAFRETTNNRMELMAAIVAVEFTPLDKKITVFSDSQYVVKGITSWVHGWVARGWKTSLDSPVMNRDLWERLLAACSARSVVFKHVKGHNGHPQNERCDTLCTRLIRDSMPNRESIQLDIKVL